MLHLPSVSLLCFCTENHAAASKAFDFSRRDISYYNHLLFTDKPEAFNVDGKTHVTVIEPLRCKQDGCVIQCTQSFNLLPPIMADFTLGINPDGFPLRPDLWNDEFLAHDFVGSPMWGWCVGNNGFCLSSRKYYECIRDLNLPASHEANFPSDQVLNCRHHADMEALGCKYASTDLSNTFAKENTLPVENTFGFHGYLGLQWLIENGLF